MTYLAGYSNESQRVHRSFFSERVSRTLGPYPNGSQGTHIWKSFMTDDHTPVELSWSWGAKDSTPAVRYAAEPISWEAGSALDPLNSKACLTCLGDTLPWAPTLDLKWYRHFLKALTWTPDYDCAKQAMSAHPPSKTFIAFDMEEDTMVVKYYFMPTLKATCSGKSNLELVEESILALPGDHSFAKSFGVITDFIRSFPLAQQPKVEILAVDCVDPSESRLKIYVRCNETTFDSMINAMTLGGRIPSFSDSTIDSLKELWCGCFSVEDTPEALSQPLGGTAHRTSGLLYYFEIKTGASKPTSKVYLPVRHYAKSDDQVAMGVSKFLQRRGKTLQGGVSYYEGLRKIWYVPLTSHHYYCLTVMNPAHTGI